MIRREAAPQLAYIISAYQRPEQLGRLVRRLAAPGTRFAVHVDAKSSDAVYAAMVDGTAGVADVEFLPRHVCHWGGFGHVRASLKGIDSLLAGGPDFDYAILLTGQDYPVLPPSELTRFFSEAGGRSFMSSWQLPFPAWSGRGGLDRFESRHLVGPRRLHVRIPGRRRVPGGLRPFGGSPYWCLARPLVEHVHEVVGARPEFVRFFERTYISDELFFQTLLLNSVHATSIENENLRYLDWSADPGPKILTRADLPRILESGKLFARKFDATVDAEVLDDLDRRLDSRPAESADGAGS